MSFQGRSEMLPSSAWVDSEPSGSPRRSRASWPATTSRLPSGSQSMQNGTVVGTRTITSLLPSRSTARISCVPQLENQSRYSCQRGDSPIARPPSKTCGSGIVDSLLLSKSRTTMSKGPHGRLALGDSFRNDTGDLLGGLETGGEPVLRQGPRNVCCGVCAREAPPDAPDPEHAPALLRVSSRAADGVAERPGRRESHDLVHTAERSGGDLAQPLGRDEPDPIHLAEQRGVHARHG